MTSTTNTSGGGPADAPKRVEFDDPHANTGPQEAETTRVRRLQGFWRYLLVALTAATIFLCINQQFTLRFFVGAVGSPRSISIAAWPPHALAYA